MSKITFDDKTNSCAPADRTKQVCAEDLNEIKNSVNELYDETDFRQYVQIPSGNCVYIGDSTNEGASPYGDVAIGYQALSNATRTGQRNNAIGEMVLIDLTTGYRNQGVGNFALQKITDGAYNTGIGNSAGSYCGTGEENTSSYAGVFIGANSKPETTTSSHEIVMGHGTVGNGNNTVTIGNDSNKDNYFTGGIHAALQDTNAPDGSEVVLGTPGARPGIIIIKGDGAGGIENRWDMRISATDYIEFYNTDDDVYPLTIRKDSVRAHVPFIPPRMTTVERNALTGLIGGEHVYDTDLKRPMYYNESTWVAY